MARPLRGGGKGRAIKERRTFNNLKIKIILL